MTNKLSRLTSAVRKVADTAMATADDRFTSVDKVIGGKLDPVTIEQPPVVQAKAQPEVVRKKLTVMLDESTWKQFRTACIHEGLTGQDILERLVEEYLANLPNG